MIAVIKVGSWFGLMLVAALMVGCGANASNQAPTSLPIAGTAGSGLVVERAWVRPAVAMEGMAQEAGTASPEGGMAPGGDGMGAMGATSAAYMVLRNDGSSADAVVKARTEVAETVELHTVTTENNVARMMPVSQIEVPAGGQTELKPGGFHVMLIGIKQDLKAGDMVDLTLTLQSGAEIQVSAPVQPQAP